MKRTLEDRFLDKVIPEPNSGCWLWLGAKMNAGYGHMQNGEGRVELAHRVAYKLYKGPIPEGLEIDHKCRTRLCANPVHLEAVTRPINIRRGVAPERNRARYAAMTHCKNGHELTPDNVKSFVRDGYIRRSCKECRRQISLRSYHRNQGKKS